MGWKAKLLMLAMTKSGIVQHFRQPDHPACRWRHLRVPRSALLDAHCEVSADGTYARTTEGIARSSAALYRFDAIDEG